MVGPAMDCLNNPLGAVRTLFEKACASQSVLDVLRSDWGAKELFDNYLHQQGGFTLVLGPRDVQDVDDQGYVPEINSARLSAIPPNSLVRFRGMVQDMFDVEYYLGAYKESPDTVKQMRDSIVNGLTNILGGDHLTAEYLLLHLLSQVHHRLDTMALGKISLNICTGPLESTQSSVRLATIISEAVQSLLPCSHLMPLSLDTLNKGLLAPRKDYVLNRLVTGSLQLAEGTYLTLDETVLNTGQLTSVGIQNIQSLKYLMEWQKVEYDFEYYKLDMPTDIPVLIISNAKSRLFPADLVVPIRSTSGIFSFAVDDSDIARWRLFLSSVRNKDHKLDNSMQKSAMETTSLQMVDPSKTTLFKSRREHSKFAAMAESQRDGAATSREASLHVTARSFGYA